MILDQPPHLILPDHWQARRPAIIRPVDAELRRAMPVMPGALIRRQPAPATLAFTYGAAAVISAAGSYSFTSVGYGTAAADRTLIAVAGMLCSSDTSAVISSVKVDGVSMTQRLTIGDTYLSGVNNCTFFTLPKASGASGTVVVAASVNTAYWALSLYAVYGLLSEVPTASLSDKTAIGTFNGSLAVSDGGIIIGGMNGRLSTNVTGTSSWSGLTANGNQTEQAQVFKHAVASQQFASGGTKSVGVTFGGGTVNTQATMFGAFR